MQRTEPSQRQGLRSSPWRKSEEGSCQLSPPDPSPLHYRRGKPPLQVSQSPTLKKIKNKKINQAFHPKQGKKLRLQPKRKKLELKVNFPGPIEETWKGTGGPGEGWPVNIGSFLFPEFEEGAL